MPTFYEHICIIVLSSRTPQSYQNDQVKALNNPLGGYWTKFGQICAPDPKARTNTY